MIKKLSLLLSILAFLLSAKAIYADGSKTKTYFVCTPVYGMANSCAEHTIVDTGLDSSLFLNFAGLSYLGGLGAFLKAKRH